LATIAYVLLGAVLLTNSNKMEILKKYVVYELNQIMGSEKHLALEKLEFKGWVSNNFDTEEDAIQALINDEKHYEDYVILKQVFLRS
jgi:hypothetical protein